jgi:hypothetical protein
MAPNFSNPQNWDLAFNETFLSDMIGSLVVGIPDFSSNLLNSSYCLIQNEVPNPKLSWRYLGNVKTTSQSTFFNAYLDKVSLEINSGQILRIKDLSSYRLSFDINQWIPSVRVKIYEYVGNL